MDDCPEVVRLADLTYRELGFPQAGGAWTAAALTQLGRRLGQDANAFVIPEPGWPGRLASCAAVSLNQRLPSPANPTGMVAYVQWVGTVAHWRRRGFARAAMRALIEWCGEVGVGRVELHAAPLAAGLYRELGFTAASNPCMRLHLPLVRSP